MARIVLVHGIGQQLEGSHTLHQTVLPALRSGLERVAKNLPNPDDLMCAFYGDLFRKKGAKSLSDPPYDESDVEEGFEKELLELWWREAARVEPQVPSPDANTKLRTPKLVQRALNALSNSKFFAGAFEKVMIGDLKQVRSYILNEDIRAQIQERVFNAVRADTEVLIGHSLGSIIAYEGLCAHPDWPIKTFITLGSPLAIRNLIFERLRPAPVGNVGMWPGKIRRWINIADDGDVVALVKELKWQFGERVQDKRIHNGATAHNIKPYLTAEETGAAIAAGLGD